MKTLITYYSFSGNTDKIAKIFRKVLESKGEVHSQRLRPKDEIMTFMAQCRAARFHKRAVLEDSVMFNVASYDIILIGSPVWAFAPTPAINTYLDKITGLNGKRVIVLLTSGSGLGVRACFKNIRKMLEDKGAARIDEINIPDKNNKDGDFVAASLQEIL